MNKGLIDKIRCMLDFIEQFDELVGEARRNGDEEREYELYAGLSHADRDLREYVSQLLSDKQDKGTSDTGEHSF